MYILKITMIVFLCLCRSLQAADGGLGFTLVSADSADAVEELMKPHLSAHTLCFFDIDETLMMPKDGIRKNQFSKELERFCADLDKQQNADIIYDTIIKTEEYGLVDTKWPEVLAKIKLGARGVYGLTSRGAKTFTYESGTVPYHINRHLQQLGITFDQVDIDWDQFQHGIVFSKPLNKGQATDIFLAKVPMGDEIKKIVMIDDRTGHLKDVGRAIRLLNAKRQSAIQFLAIHYTGYDQVPYMFDSRVVAKQKEYLIKFTEYLSDEQARKLIEEEQEDRA